MDPAFIVKMLSSVAKDPETVWRTLSKQYGDAFFYDQIVKDFGLARDGLQSAQARIDSIVRDLKEECFEQIQEAEQDCTAKISVHK